MRPRAPAAVRSASQRASQGLRPPRGRPAPPRVGRDCRRGRGSSRPLSRRRPGSAPPGAVPGQTRDAQSATETGCRGRSHHRSTTAPGGVRPALIPDAARSPRIAELLLEPRRPPCRGGMPPGRIERPARRRGWLSDRRSHSTSLPVSFRPAERLVAGTAFEATPGDRTGRFDGDRSQPAPVVSLTSRR